MAFAAALTEKRGPRVGDAASLWNFTPAPGWTREEVHILRLCLMKHGVGQWLQILGTGLLPGKMIQQLNGQTQRLLGQQSLAAFTGLRVDVDRVRQDNEAKKDATRKSGLVIYNGPQLSKEEKAAMREEAQRKYGLTPEQTQKVDEELEEVMRFASAAASAAAGAGPEGGCGAGAAAVAGPGSLGLSSAQAHAQAVARHDPELGCLLAVPTEDLSAEQLVLLLKRLRNRLACLVDRYHDRASLPPRCGPRWEGERCAGAVLEEAASAVAAAAAAAAAATAAASAGAAAGGGRICSRGGPTDGIPGVSRAARKRSKPSKARAGATSSGDGGDWSGGEENAGPSGGGKRKAVEAPAGARRGTRAKRPARYDKYVDDNEYDEVDPDAGGPQSLIDPTEALNTLTAMGFTPRKARGALRECHFNVEAAVEWLCANCV